MKDTQNKDIHVFAKAINKYINLLNSQMETFPLIMNTLVFRLKACYERVNDFITKNNIEKTKK